MSSITETINDLIIKTSGGILFLWLAIFFYAKKVFMWCGRKIAEGANKDLVDKLMPSIAKYVEDKIKEFKDDTIKTLSSELAEVKKSVEEYKNVKHNIETENRYLKQIIKENDQELLELIKRHLNEKK